MAFGWLKKAVKSATGSVAGLGSKLSKIPIVGGGLKGTFNLTIGAPFAVAHAVASGTRIDHVVLDHFKNQIGAIKDVAPYAQTVLSLVPGVGFGMSGIIAAGLAVASGKRIDSALLEGVKGALPGGQLAKAAFDIGHAAIQGRPIDEAALGALPLSSDQKKILVQGLKTAKGLAHGEKLDAALMHAALGALPPDARKAVTIGMALGHGQVLQAAKDAGVMPAVYGFKGKPALAIGAGSLKMGHEAAKRIAAAATGKDPVAKAEAKEVVKATLDMATNGTPVQRKVALAGLAAIRMHVPPQGGKVSSPQPVRRGWFVSPEGRVTRT